MLHIWISYWKKESCALERDIVLKAKIAGLVAAETGETAEREMESLQTHMFPALGADQADPAVRTAQ